MYRKNTSAVAVTEIVRLSEKAVTTSESTRRAAQKGNTVFTAVRTSNLTLITVDRILKEVKVYSFNIFRTYRIKLQKSGETFICL
jgi:hypothetical protein